MVDQQIKISFLGDDGNLTKSLNQLQDELKQLEKDLKNATNIDVFNKLQKEITNTKSNLDALQKSGASVATQFGRTSRSSNEATQSLVNLSRVAQDAPYGFLGIANNLNPLLESFQRLQASTGSTSGALKSLAGSITGVGGIGLALGVVSSLLVVFGDKLFGAKEKVDQTKEGLKQMNEMLERSKKAFDDLGDSIDYLKELGDINLNINGQDNRLGLQADALDLDRQIYEAQQDTDRLKDLEIKNIGRIADLKAEIDRVNKIPFAFRIGTDTPIEKAEAEIQRIEGGMQALVDAIEEKTKLVTGLQRKQQVQFRKINLDQVEDQREADAKALEAAKKRAAANKALYDKQLREYEAYVKAMANLRDWLNANKAKLDLAIDTNQVPVIPSVPDGTTRFFKTLEELQNRSMGDTSRMFGLPSAEELKQLEYSFSTAGRMKKAFEDLGVVGTQAAYGLGDAFAAFSTALFNGENALKAFGQSIVQAFSQVIAQLLKTAAIAAVLSVISGGAAGGGLSFAKAFTGLMGGNLAGRGNTSGGALGGVSRAGGFVGMNPIMVEVSGRLRGNDIALMGARTSQTQRRGG